MGFLTPQRLAFALYYGMRVLVAAAIVWFLVDRDWEFAFYSVLILGAMVVPATLKDAYRLYLPFELDLALVSFIFLSLFLGNMTGFYQRFAWWDAMLHFQSGILAGIVGFVLVYVLNATQSSAKLNLSSGFVAFFSFTFALAVAVIWEIYEFSVDTFFGYNTQESGWPDTMGDLIMATLGGAIVATIGYLWMRRRAQVPFTPRLLARFQYRGQKHQGK